MIIPKPLILLILDGFGISAEKEGNPVFQANTPNLAKLEKDFPFTALQASGTAVGLPWGEAGNSEVGHLTIGSGRALYHHLLRIIYSIYDGSFFKNDHFLKAAEFVRNNHSALHIAGLMSSGSVHSYIDHLYALLDFTKRENISPVYIHIFTDGKDAPPKEGARFLQILEERIKIEWPHAKLASVVGRFYAMDRDEKWERTEKAYSLLSGGAGKKVSSLSEYLNTSYEDDITDEFIEPAAISNENAPAATIKEGDALIFFNFREDSMRQITHAFVDAGFDKFPRKKIENLLVITMTEYQKDWVSLAAFPALNIDWPLSRVLGEKGLRHLHIAESQKYAHVTYFFNGGVEKPFPGEERILIPSMATAHFDEAPEMRAPEITQTILDNMEKYDVIIANLANADMVGHSGNFASAIKTVEILDESVGKLQGAVLKGRGAMIITADHGNIELKRNVITGEKLTEHSLNPVPCILVGNEFKFKKPINEEEVLEKRKDIGGILTDIAPTILDLLKIHKPTEMTGQSMLPVFLSQINKMS